MIDWDKLNFVPEELQCKCCKVLKVDADFLETLQEIRNIYGKPMNVSSGYRCSAHPIESRKVERGGKPGSHSSGKAVDIRCTGSGALALLRVALSHGKVTGVGVNQKGPYDARFIHLDTVVTSPRPNIWSY